MNRSTVDQEAGQDQGRGEPAAQRGAQARDDDAAGKGARGGRGPRGAAGRRRRHARHRPPPGVRRVRAALCAEPGALSQGRVRVLLDGVRPRSDDGDQGRGKRQGVSLRGEKKLKGQSKQKKKKKKKKKKKNLF
jgi:hypothetical protein